MSEELEQIIERAKTDIEQIGEAFDAPDDDWLPALLVHSRDDKWIFAGIDPEFMSTELTKDLLAQMVLPELVLKNEGLSCAFISSAWAAESGKDEPMPGQEGYLPPSERPDRIEVVMIQAMTAVEAKMVRADIIRHENAPPTLSDWMVWSSSASPYDKTEFTGRFVDPLRRALAPQG